MWSAPRSQQVRPYGVCRDQVESGSSGYGRRTSVILPCLGRTEVDVQASESAVHDSRGYAWSSEFVARRTRAGIGESQKRSDDYRGRRRGDGRRQGRHMLDGFSRLRPDSRSGVESGSPDLRISMNGYAHRVDSMLRSRRRSAASTPPPARQTLPSIRSGQIQLGAEQFLMMTIRSHDQFNTTIYGLDDRYRGVHGGRRGDFHESRGHGRSRARRAATGGLDQPL